MTNKDVSYICRVCDDDPCVMTVGPCTCDPSLCPFAIDLDDASSAKWEKVMFIFGGEDVLDGEKVREDEKSS